MPFHISDISSTGKLQDAAIAKARPTMKATLLFSNLMPRPIAMMPSTTVVIFDTRISSCSFALPPLMTVA